MANCGGPNAAPRHPCGPAWNMAASRGRDRFVKPQLPQKTHSALASTPASTCRVALQDIAHASKAYRVH